MSDDLGIESLIAIIDLTSTRSVFLAASPLHAKDGGMQYTKDLWEEWE